MSARRVSALWQVLRHTTKPKPTPLSRSTSIRLFSALCIRLELQKTLYKSPVLAVASLSESAHGTGSMDPSWRPPAPCKVGDPLSAIDTPALILDLDSAESNLALLPELLKKWPGVVARVHAKAHKTPALAKLQIEHGSAGMCCQTLVEAEAMVYGAGITDILLSNQLIGSAKIQRLASLAKHADVSVCVDSTENIADISQVATKNGVCIGCVVEVDVGQHRCGVQPGNAAAVLAKQITDMSGIYFKGIQCYQGLNQHVRKAEDRKKNVDNIAELTKITLKALSDHGIDCQYVTGGGTGSFPYEAATGIFTEVQPGSYVVMDADYARNYGEDGNLTHTFKQSIYILTTVQSVTDGERAVVDAGMKAVSLDSGPPQVAEHKEMTYTCGGDEHGILTPPGTLKVGDLLQLVPGHCDPTCNLYDWMVGVRKETVETVWPILGRGPGV